MRPTLIATTGLTLLWLCSAAGGAGDEPVTLPDAPVVALSDELREALSPLGSGVVGEALPAAPIVVPSRLFHLAPGRWEYRIVAGANKGQLQSVRLERVTANDRGATWELVSSNGEVQQLKETTSHEVVKLAQEDADSDRIVVYRPGLVLDPGMKVGEGKTVRSALRTHKRKRPDKVEYDGELDYTTRYLGAYRVETPAGRFDARLLEHEYDMKIGPAKAHHKSYVFYADDVGNVAEVSREKVSALFVYNRSSLTARVMVEAPSPAP